MIMSKAQLLIFFSIVSLIACQNGKSQKERELDLREQELKLKEKELEYRRSISTNSVSNTSTRNIPLTKTMYMYVVLKVNQPEIAIRMTPGEQTAYEKLNDLPAMPGKEKYWRDSYYTIQSDVVAINNYTEDKKYIEIDAVKAQIRQQWARSPLVDIDAGSTQREILSAEGRVFSSYAEASISKSKRQ
jgi:hypothetical protein